MKSAHPNRLREWIRRLSLFAGSSILALLIVEGGVRLFLPQQLILLRSDIWVPHDGLGWNHAPDLNTVVNTGERSVRLQTDRAGHRIGKRPLSASDSRRILALGDSFLAALQVEYEDTVGGRLEKALSRDLREPIRIVNSGVGVWGPSHYLLKTIEELGRDSYELVLIFLFLGNDVERRRVDSFAPRHPTTRHHFRLPRSLETSEWLDALAYPINDTLETRSHLFVLIKGRSWQFLMRAGLSARWFPDVFLISEADSERWRVTADLCADIDSAAVERGSDTLFVLLPGAYQVEPELGRAYAEVVGVNWEEVDLEQPARLLRQELIEHGLWVEDATPALRAARGTTNENLYGRIDTHLSPKGHEALAEFLAPHISGVLIRRRESAVFDSD